MMNTTSLPHLASSSPHLIAENRELHPQKIIEGIIITLKSVGNTANETFKLATEVFHLQVKSGTTDLSEMATMLYEIEQLCINKKYLAFAQFFVGVRNIAIGLAGMGHFISDFHDQGLSVAFEKFKTGQNFSGQSSKADVLPRRADAEAPPHAAATQTAALGPANEYGAELRGIAKANAGVLLIAARKRIIHAVGATAGFMATGLKKGAMALTAQCRHHVVPSIKHVLLMIASRSNRLPTKH